jgi:hypothetical protein
MEHVGIIGFGLVQQATSWCKRSAGKRAMRQDITRDALNRSLSRGMLHDPVHPQIRSIPQLFGAPTVLMMMSYPLESSASVTFSCDIIEWRAYRAAKVSARCRPKVEALLTPLD